MTESEKKAIINRISAFRGYFKSQLKKNLNFPIKCHSCETLLDKKEAFFHYTTIDKWKIIQADLLHFLKTNNEKPTNESLWKIFGTELTSEPVIFVCENCLSKWDLSLNFSTIFYDGAPQNFKTEALKFILRKGNPDIHHKFFLKIVEILKNPDENYQNGIWEAMGSAISLLIKLNNISTYLTEWMTIIEDKNPNSDTLIIPLSVIGLLIPKTDCKQFSNYLSKLSVQDISKIFQNITKKTTRVNWYELIENLDFNMQKTMLLKIILNRNTNILKKIFKNLINYSTPFQNYLYTEIDSMGDIILWKELIEKIPVKDFFKLNIKIQEKFDTILDNYQKEKIEVREQNKIYLRHKQDKYNNKKVIPFRKTALLLTQEYRKIIEQHIKTYQDEFNSFFKLYPESLLGFDVEEIDNYMICVMGIKINPDLSIRVTTQAINDIYSLKRSSRELRKKFEIWIKNQDSKWVITHGSNPNESKLVQKSHSIDINSELFLSNVSKKQEIEGKYLMGSGLRHFEKFINFTRKGCGIIKHKTKPNLFFKQFLVSLDRHLLEDPQRQCNLCGKTQDVLLYCLEDAFVSILIVVWFVNRVLIPEKQEKNFPKK